MRKYIVRLLMTGCLCLPMTLLNPAQKAYAAVSYEYSIENSGTSSDNIVVCRVSDFVNVRSAADSNSSVVGIMENSSAGVVLDQVAAADGQWYHIQSGAVTGYVKAENFVSAAEAKSEASSKIIKVKSDITTIHNDIEFSFTEGEEYQLTSEEGDRVQFTAKDGNSCSLPMSVVDIRLIFKDANTAEEDNRVQQSAASQARSEVVAYALQFVGNPYRYGGTSLTNGADCSGFTSSVYKHFGYSISRDSRSQAANGREIGIENIQPGDLVFYARGGRINHVALYIGDGKIVHASTARTGIIVANMYYSRPCKVVSVIN